MRCLPGMEGGPVLDGAGALVGVLGAPLSSSALQAEARVYVSVLRTILSQLQRPTIEMV